MKDIAFHQRREMSALDFTKGLLEPMQRQFNARIFSVEELPDTELVQALDYQGVDGFIMDSENIMRGLASRVNYAWFRHRPCFSFRYGLRNRADNGWIMEREYKHKLHIVNHPDKPIYPEWHVESFSQQKGSGLIHWAYMARTKDILNYIEANRQPNTFKGYNGVEFKHPTHDEKRVVVCVSVEALAKACEVQEIRI